MLSCIMLGKDPQGFESLESFIKGIPFVFLIDRFQSLKDANRLLQTGKVHVALLGNQVEEMQGPHLAGLEPVNTLPVLLLSYPENIRAPFIIHAVEVLSQPFTFTRLYQVLQKFSNLINMEQTVTPLHRLNDHFMLWCGNRHEKIVYNELLYIEVMDDHILLHMQDHRVATTEKLDWIMSRLPVASFLRVHRWFVVSLQHITRLADRYIWIGSSSIPITRESAKIIESYLKKE